MPPWRARPESHGAQPWAAQGLLSGEGGLDDGSQIMSTVQGCSGSCSGRPHGRHSAVAPASAAPRALSTRRHGDACVAAPVLKLLKHAMISHVHAPSAAPAGKASGQAVVQQSHGRPRAWVAPEALKSSCSTSRSSIASETREEDPRTAHCCCTSLPDSYHCGRRARECFGLVSAQNGSLVVPVCGSLQPQPVAIRRESAVWAPAS